MPAEPSIDEILESYCFVFLGRTDHYRSLIPFEKRLNSNILADRSNLERLNNHLKTLEIPSDNGYQLVLKELDDRLSKIFYYGSDKPKLQQTLEEENKKLTEQIIHLNNYSRDQFNKRFVFSSFVALMWSTIVLGVATWTIGKENNEFPQDLATGLSFNVRMLSERNPSVYEQLSKSPLDKYLLFFEK